MNNVRGKTRINLAKETLKSMYNSIYGSPFPKINPKVRYKTALERAGFDTKPRNPFSSQRNASTGSLQASVKSPPITRQRNVSAAPSVPVTMKSAYTASSKSAYSSVKGESDIYPPPVLENSERRSVTPPKNSNFTSSRPSDISRSISRPSERASQEDPFRFERDLDRQAEQYTASRHTCKSPANKEFQAADNFPFNFEREDAGNTEREQDLSPIERSFMMLTQNDTASVVNSMNQTDNRGVLDQKLGKEQQKEESSIEYGSEGQQEDENDIESLNFEPDPKLQVNLENEPLQDDFPEAKQEEKNTEPKIPEINVTRESNTPSLTMNALDSKIYPDDNFSGLESSKEQKSPGVSSSSTKVEDLSLDGLNEKRLSITSSENVETPYTATNLQVEQLIAQLDDVSLSRNAKLDMNGNCLNAVDRKASRFKKSSAYLSGYPSMDIPVTQQTSIVQNNNTNLSRQTILVDKGDVDEDAPSESTTNGGTPIFYKFKQSNVEYSNNEGMGSQETFRTKLPTIEALQLQHKRNITDLREEIDNSKSNDSHVLSNGGTTRYSSDADYKETEPIEFKYPPGEGPCRACGLEVTGKRMFSKKENELSGQWHRECFKCIECGIKFNKHVPCYILGDEPYCQKHYHEENHSICKVCSNFIEGECLENDKVERFHVDCLNCFLCKTAITNDYYIFNGEIPLCGNHDMEALLKEGIDNATSSNDKNNTLSKRRTRLINFN